MQIARVGQVSGIDQWFLQGVRRCQSDAAAAPWIDQTGLERDERTGQFRSRAPFEHDPHVGDLGACGGADDRCQVGDVGRQQAAAAKDIARASRHERERRRIARPRNAKDDGDAKVILKIGADAR